MSLTTLDPRRQDGRLPTQNVTSAGEMPSRQFEYGRLGGGKVGAVTPFRVRQSRPQGCDRWPSPRHCEERSDEAIHAAAREEMDCFAEPVIGRAFARPVGSQ